LDIVALLLLGVVTKLGFDYIQGQEAYIPRPISKIWLTRNLNFEQQILLLAIIIIFLFATRTLVSIWGNRRVLKYLGSQSALASNTIVRQLFESKPQFLLSKNSQELLYGATTGIDNMVLNYLGSLTLLLSESFFISALILSLMIVNPLVGICAIIIFGGSGFLFHRITSTKAKVYSEESGLLGVKYSQNFLETLSVYRELSLRGSLSNATIEVQFLRNQYLVLRAKLLFLPLLSKYFFEMILIVGGALVTFGQFIMTDAITAVSSLVVFLGASIRIMPSVIRIQNSILSLKQSEGAGQITLRQLEEFDLNKNILYPKIDVAERIDCNSEYLILNQVSFRYPKSDNFALINLTARIRKGQFVAVVGDSGAGKSTLVDLILGIKEPTTGEIKLDGLSPTSFVSNYPGYVAYVPQDISIIDGSIVKNIILCEDGSFQQENVINALKQSALWDDVQKMKNGINSVVGERGSRLSGGQRQRLGIARALYSNPELIVFDEATSSLDPLTEKAVTDSIYNNRGSTTLIVIAHRLSTVKNADLILYLEEGLLMGSGTFDEVREKVPKFDKQARLVNL
jgi:ATP-binding cassette subfamily C protein